MSLSSSELLVETLLGCTFNLWFSPPECVSLVVTRAISKTSKHKFIKSEGEIKTKTKNLLPHWVYSMLCLHRKVLTNGCWCQFNANRNPSLGDGEEGNLFQCKNSSIVTHHSCESSKAVKQLGSPAVMWSALVCLILLPQGLVFGVSNPSGETQFLVFSGKGKCSSGTEGELTYIDKGPCPRSLIGQSSCK